MKPPITTLPSTLPAEAIFHFAMAVPDLERAMAQGRDALGIAWTRVRDVVLPLRGPSGERSETAFQAVYSLQGPPYVELVCGPRGSLFGAPDGPRLHHAGLIVDDPGAEARRLEGLGYRITGTAVTADGSPGSVVYVAGPFGLQLELMAPPLRGVLDDWLFPEGFPPSRT